MTTSVLASGLLPCATAVVAGHVWPLWHEFRGGKGAATLIGCLIGLAPWLLLPVLATWFVCVALTGFVGLGTMLAAGSAPIALAVAGPPFPLPLLAWLVIIAGFIVWTHRSNIARMRAGVENRARRLWLFAPRP